MVTRDAELNYFRAIGEDGRTHAITKPFSDADRAGMFLEIGAILSLLPPPPATVLDCGCGTGWLTWLLQRSGYSATGIDVAPLAVQLAMENPPYHGVSPPRFVVGSVEDRQFDGEFDAVLFFDALHHTTDEEAALRSTLHSLKPGGICLTSEPGTGHAEASRHTVDQFGVTERDMPAWHIVEVGLRVGFATASVFPRADDVGIRLYSRVAPAGSRWKRRLKVSILGRSLRTLKTIELAKRDNGIVLLTAPALPQ
jgi:SAM-dependent methyltransferase